MTNSDPPHSNGGGPTSLLLDELIVEILSRLPVKTLMQFKCVCKSWKTLISHDPSFVKLHLQRSPRNTHLALVSDLSSDYESNCSVVPFPVSHLLEAPLTIILTILTMYWVIWIAVSSLVPAMDCSV